MSGDGRLQRVETFLRSRLGEAWEIKPSPKARTVIAGYTWDDGTRDTLFAMDIGWAYGHRDDPTGETVMDVEGLIPGVLEIVNDWTGPR
jgi:hypothetical protein